MNLVPVIAQSTGCSMHCASLAARFAGHVRRMIAAALVNQHMES
jgi:hypothetical protein